MDDVHVMNLRLEARNRDRSVIKLCLKACTLDQLKEDYAVVYRAFKKEWWVLHDAYEVTTSSYDVSEICDDEGDPV